MFSSAGHPGGSQGASCEVKLIHIYGLANFYTLPSVGNAQVGESGGRGPGGRLGGGWES